MSNGNDMAFPVLDRTQTPNDTYQLGLTKREYFAVLAMQGLASNGRWETDHNVHQTAAEAVSYADALLQELAK